ncbi:hypothetical protein, partial [Burkholderia cepacia]|uniref:hypothetical protein n=1 Tax=Burkholderia cepacia TaxID=292 RepID=UPI003FF0BD65
MDALRVFAPAIDAKTRRDEPEPAATSRNAVKTRPKRGRNGAAWQAAPEKSPRHTRGRPAFDEPLPEPLPRRSIGAGRAFLDRIDAIR